MLLITLTAEDALAVYTGIGSNDRKIPTRLITRTDFPTAPDASVDLPVPYPYGNLSVPHSASAPPQWVPDPARGTAPESTSATWVIGHADIATPPTAPTNVAAVATGSGGSLNLGDVPANTYYVIVTSIDANGNESDPEPFLQDAESATISADGSKIDVSWTASGDATAYRAYIGYYYYYVRFSQYIQTASTSCTFDKVPPFGTDATTSTISTGATLTQYAPNNYYYAVSAIVSDGETSKSQVGQAKHAPYPRPIHLEWTAVTGATGYRIYKRPDFSDKYIWRFDTTSTSFDDDLTNATAIDISGVPDPAGLLPCVHVGERYDSAGIAWQAFLVAGCAVKSITNVYQGGLVVDPGNFGVTFAVPGKTNFSTYFGATTYVEINGRRYTLLYVRGPQADAAVSGERPITVTLQGIEATGDGSGALITELPQQYEHLLRNLVLRDYETGNWETVGPTWGDTPTDVDLVDGLTFDTVSTIWAARGPGACPGAWVLGLSETGALEQVTVRTQLARLNQSMGGYGGFSRKSAYSVFVIDETADITSTERFTATAGINEGTFEIEDRPDEIENQILVRYALDAPHGVWSEFTVQDVDAQTAIGGEVKPYTLNLWAIRNQAVAYEIATRRLLLRKFPYRIVRWESDMGGLIPDLGDTVRVSHPDGMGTSGWTDRPVFITRHEFDTQRYVVQFDALDLAPVRVAQDPAQTWFGESVTIGEVSGLPPWMMQTTDTFPGDAGSAAGGDPDELLLLETGDGLLLETGDGILLE